MNKVLKLLIGVLVIPAAITSCKEEEPAMNTLEVTPSSPLEFAHHGRPMLLSGY